MPGLVDAHAHYFDRDTFGRLFLANGVTLVRDTGMTNELILPLRADLESHASSDRSCAPRARSSTGRRP
jgi:cytosine/adenosine deaminase-related metal-dependent hydrolase